MARRAAALGSGARRVALAVAAADLFVGGVTMPSAKAADLGAIRHIINLGDRGPWKLAGHQVAELNKHLMGAIVVVARCGQST